ncbi:Nose resistant to fluoxetine protein 6 like protein [Argiope bruennichi]|uniref:Nose resistant to fluoxetine protein 6 like protein n=1 Tax=Argiope bruennichi TaxID=94029 RepID=A0A8T0FJ03_ARGBR|nr:Nose resistant to fluoxetine protein 6 like protein [Argiope bruennichi]
MNSLGDYDECIETVVSGHFQGQYCLLDITPPLPKRRPFVSSDSMIKEFVNLTDPESTTAEFLRYANYYYHLKFRSSVCVPSTCSADEVQQIAAKVMEHIGFAIRCLLCFSFYTNTRRLLKKDDSKDSIKIFHGMKVITILWVILNHTYYYTNLQVFSGLLNAREFGKQKAFQLIANGFLNVETFFFISAVLVAYGVMKMKEKQLNVFLFIFRRLWRLTPPFMFVIATVYILPHFGSGPVWKETVIDGLSNKCTATWWTNLLYINNFIPSSEMCLQWTWYIPVDTHMYFLSLFVLIPLKRNPKLAFLMNGIIFISGIVVSAISNVYYNLHPTAIYVYNHPEDINHFIERGYFRTYLHFSTYCVGLTVGYLLASKKKRHIPLLLNLSGWLTSFLLGLSVLYGVYQWNQGDVPGIVLSTVYTCTNKLAWSLALAWVTFSCITGNGGIITSILSWEAFVPFSRLTYMAYLIHPIIQFIYIGSTRTVIETTHRAFVFIYLSNVVLAFMCAYFFSLLFESPFMALEKVLLRTGRNFTKEPPSSDNRTDQEVKQDIKEIYSSNVSEDKNTVYSIKIKYLETNET